MDAAIDAPPPDAFPPIHLLSTDPADGATGVPVNRIVTATVDEDVYGYDTTSFIVSALGIEAVGDVNFAPAIKQLRFVPIDQYRPNTMYTVNITAAITNMAGFPLGPHQWSFTTGDDPFPPQVKQTMPFDGAMQVPTDATIIVRFDEPVSGVDATSYAVTDGANAITGTFTVFAGQDYTFQPDAALPAGETITVSLSSAIQDLSGNALAPTSFSFTTAP